MKPVLITELIYKEDWSIHDGPLHAYVFKNAINHPQFKRISMDREGWDNEKTIIQVYTEREETEEERKDRKRKNRLALQKNKQAALEREKEKARKEFEEYERLKKKFEQ